MQFAPLDFFVVGVFFVAIIALGFSAKLKDNSILQFLAAGRNLSLPAFVATLVTVWYGGILGIAESVSAYGTGAWLLLGVPYYVFAIVYALWFAKKVRGAEQLSIPERLHARWGKGAGLVSGGLVFLLAVPAAHVLMLGILVKSFTGWGNGLAIVVGALIGVSFLYKGGLLADVRVGMLAFLMMYVGFIVTLIYSISTHAPSSIQPILQEAGALDWSGGKGWIVILTFFILGAWTLVDPGFHQRVASARSPEVGRRGVFVSVGFWFLFDCLSMSTALYALALTAPKPDNALLLYPAYANQVLPAGLKAVFFCGMIGTILSAMVGYTLVSGTTVGREIIARLKPTLPDVQVTRLSQGGLILGCGIAVLLALNIESVVSLWYAWGGCVIGALLVPVVMAYLRQRIRVSAEWVCAAMALAFLVSFGWLVYGLQTSNPYLNVAIIQGSSGDISVKAEAEALVPQQGRTDLPIGTMVPALVVSGLVMALGSFACRKRETNG